MSIREDNIAKILAAAEECLAGQGYGGASFSRIATHNGDSAFSPDQSEETGTAGNSILPGSVCFLAKKAESFRAITPARQWMTE